MANEAIVRYQWIPGVERLEKYTPGGFHPIVVDQIIHDRYRIVDKLGYGGYSTIWLARDTQLQKYVALKVGMSDSTSVRREVRMLRLLSEQSPAASVLDLTLPPLTVVLEVLDDFEINGPNGRHACYTLMPMQGDLRETSFSQLFHVSIARAIAAKLMLVVAFLHAQGICHGDIHLGNVLAPRTESLDQLSVEEFREQIGGADIRPVKREDGLPLPPNVPPFGTVRWSTEKRAEDFTLEEAKGIVLSDLGEVFDPTSADEQRLGIDCHVPMQKRPPEAFFAADKPLTYASDIWSLGLAIWDVIGIIPLFYEGEPASEMAGSQIAVCGPHHFPPQWKAIWERPNHDVSEEDERPHRSKYTPGDSCRPLEQMFEDCVALPRKQQEEARGVFDADETSAILDLMRGMLRLDPAKRMTIDEALRSEWMVKWALPELRKV